MNPIRAINLLAIVFVLASLAFGLADHCAALVSAVAR